MSIPSYQRINATGTTNPVMLDWTLVPFNASYAVTLTTGTGTYKVQFTLDDPNSTATVTWFDDVNAPANSTTNIAGNYIAPVQAVRLNCSSLGNSAVMQFAVLQGLPV